MTISSVDVRSAAADYISRLKDVLDATSLDQIETFIGFLHDARENDRQVFIVGDGGSAATASHMACDLSKTVLGSPPTSTARRFRVQALTDNVALLTAWGNDVRYDAIFAEPDSNLAKPGDLLLVITGSGNSPNVLEAVSAAHDLGLSTVGLLGFNGGRVRELLDHAVTSGIGQLRIYRGRTYGVGSPRNCSAKGTVEHGGPTSAKCCPCVI